MRNPVAAVAALAVTVLTGLAPVVLTLGAAAPSAEAAGYPGVARTSCSVNGVTLTPGSGARPGVTVQVSTGNLRPTGRIALTYLHQPGGDRWSSSHAYAGGVLRIGGPRLARPGTYRVTATYEPSTGSIYRGCHGTTSFHYTAQALADASGTHHQGSPGPTSGHPGTTETTAHDADTTTGTTAGTTTGSATGVQDGDRSSGSPLHGLLAATGNPVTLTLVAAALALLALGASLMRRPAAAARRRRGGRGTRR